MSLQILPLPRNFGKIRRGRVFSVPERAFLVKVIFFKQHKGFFFQNIWTIGTAEINFKYTAAHTGISVYYVGAFDLSNYEDKSQITEVFSTRVFLSTKFPKNYFL